MAQSINQSIYFNLHHSMQCYIYIHYNILNIFDTNWGCTKDTLSLGRAHTSVSSIVQDTYANPSITFQVALDTNRQTDTQTDRQTIFHMHVLNFQFTSHCTDSNFVRKKLHGVDDMSRESAAACYKTFSKEIKMLATLKHNNIVTVKGITTSPFAMILEYCVFEFRFLGIPDVKVHNLAQFLVKLDTYDVVEAVAEQTATFINILQDVVLGVDYLHSQNIAHRDLKPQNILVQNTHNDDGKLICCKLTDFGESRSSLIQTQSLLRTNTSRLDRCTVPFQSPEQLLRTANSASISSLKEMDIWALGQISYCIINPDMHCPYVQEYNECTIKDIKEVVRQCMLRKTLPRPSPKYSCLDIRTFHVVKGLQEICSQFDPSDRPTSQTILEFLERHVNEKSRLV